MTAPVPSVRVLEGAIRDLLYGNDEHLVRLPHETERHYIDGELVHHRMTGENSFEVFFFVPSGAAGFSFPVAPTEILCTTVTPAFGDFHWDWTVLAVASTPTEVKMLGLPDSAYANACGRLGDGGFDTVALSVVRRHAEVETTEELLHAHRKAWAELDTEIELLRPRWADNASFVELLGHRSFYREQPHHTRQDIKQRTMSIRQFMLPPLTSGEAVAEWEFFEWVEEMGLEDVDKFVVLTTVKNSHEKLRTSVQASRRIASIRRKYLDDRPRSIRSRPHLTEFKGDADAPWASLIYRLGVKGLAEGLYGDPSLVEPEAGEFANVSVVPQVVCVERAGTASFKKLRAVMTLATKCRTYRAPGSSVLFVDTRSLGGSLWRR